MKIENKKETEKNRYVHENSLLNIVPVFIY